MIGNDVVDLEFAARQSNWRRKGFLQKVFSEGEQQLILGSSRPYRLVWLLWSMKEAAYKAQQRRFDLPRKLNWHEFRCFLNSYSTIAASGVVKTGDSEYFTSSEISGKYIHTSAETSETRTAKNGIFETSSEEMKRLFLQKLSAALNFPEQELSLQKNFHGIPYVAWEKKEIFSSFSFSGHGRYCAFSMAVNDL